MQHLLLFCLVLSISSLTAQTTVAVMGDCLGSRSFDFLLDATRSPDATGRNVYTNQVLEVDLAFDATAENWQLQGGGFVFYAADNEFFPNPPSSDVADYAIQMDCTNLTGQAVVSGNGAQGAQTAKVYNATRNQGYQLIQDAVNDVPAPGDPGSEVTNVIEVTAGTYTEDVVTGNKNIKFLFVTMTSAPPPQPSPSPTVPVQIVPESSIPDTGRSGN